MTDEQPMNEGTTGSSAPLDGDESGTDWTNTGDAGGGSADEAAGGWSSGGRPGAGRASAMAQHWLAELQSIAENLAKESVPVIREVGAKAAEIAAIAADRAGPLAIRAADATAQASTRVAENSRSLAAELRRPPTAGEGGESPADDGTDSGPTDAGSGGDDRTAPQGPTV